MRAPLCLFCLCQGSSAAHQGVVGGQDVGAPSHLVWEWLAVCSAMVVALVLALAMKWLTRKQVPQDRKMCQQEEAPGDPEEMKRRLLRTFSHMEQELVKLMTLIRNRKASLVTHHRGCKASDCQRVRENNKAFNLAVYDIIEE